MSAPPLKLDGARVVAFADVERLAPSGKTRHTVDGVEVRPDRLAVATYDESEGYYLFYCDAAWSVLTDTFHDTLELAKEQADFEFPGVQFERRV